MATHTLRRPRRSRQRMVRDTMQSLVVHALLLAIGSVFVLPLLWTIGSSLKQPGAGIRFPPQFFPEQFMWGNYGRVFELIPFMTFFRNSLVVTSLAVCGELLSSSLVAFAFARLRFPGRNALFLLLLATMMIPYPVTMVPTFIMFKQLNLINTYAPLILPPFFGSAFSIFLLRQFFLTINMELDEAAKVDGANEFRIYRQIILPLAKPALATVAIFAFMNYWNDFLNPLIYLSESDKYTLAVGIFYLRSFRGGNELAYQMAASVMFVAPCIIMFFVAQRFLVQGIVTTGLKG